MMCCRGKAHNMYSQGVDAMAVYGGSILGLYSKLSVDAEPDLH
jgi:hypothetical protein